MNKSNRISLTARCSALIAVASLVSPAIAQEQTGESERRVETSQPEDLRAQLQRQLETVQEHQRLLANAIKQLDEGKDPGVVRTELREAGGERGPRGGQGQGPRDGRRRGGDGGGPPGQRQSREITPEDRDKIVVFIQEQSPTLWERIKDEPESIDRFVQRFSPRYFAFVDASGRDGPLGELTLAEFQAGYGVMRAIGDLYRAYGQSTPDKAKIESAIKSIETAITKQFDIRLQIQRRELTLLKQRVEELETEVETKATNRTETLLDHLRRITEDVKRRIEHAGERRGGRRGGGRQPGGEGGGPGGGGGDRDHH